MSDRLHLEYVRDTDGTGELTVSATWNEYSGKGRAWFHDREVEAFGRALSDTFPLSAGSELRLEGGYWRSRSSPPQLEEALVSLTVYPVGATGTIAVFLELKEGKAVSLRDQSRAHVKLEILTNYEALRALGQKIAAFFLSGSATADLPFGAASQETPSK